ncbi:MAG: transglutaminase domain-containing protein [archaeon]
MVSKKAIGISAGVVVVAIIITVSVWRPSTEGGTIFEDTVEPMITYEPVLSVQGYEVSGSWTRSASSFPEYRSTINCIISNTGNAVAENVNFEIRVDGNLVVTQLYESVPAQGSESYVNAVTTSYDSSRTIEVKTWCSESSDVYTFYVEHDFPRYWSQDPDILKLFIMPNEFSVAYRENQIVENKFFITANWMAIRDWVGNSIEYVTDGAGHGERDYWQFPSETMNRGTGDCEDFSILLCSLLRANDWAPNEVYVVIGTTGDSCHAWVKIDMGILGWYHLEPQAGSWGLIGDIGLWLRGYDDVYQFNDVYCEKVQ